MRVYNNGSASVSQEHTTLKPTQPDVTTVLVAALRGCASSNPDITGSASASCQCAGADGRTDDHENFACCRPSTLIQKDSGRTASAAPLTSLCTSRSSSLPQKKNQFAFLAVSTIACLVPAPKQRNYYVQPRWLLTNRSNHGRPAITEKLPGVAKKAGHRMGITGVLRHLPHIAVASLIILRGTTFAGNCTKRNQHENPLPRTAPKIRSKRPGAPCFLQGHLPEHRQRPRAASFGVFQGLPGGAGRNSMGVGSRSTAAVETSRNRMLSMQ